MTKTPAKKSTSQAEQIALVVPPPSAATPASPADFAPDPAKAFLIHPDYAIGAAEGRVRARRQHNIRRDHFYVVLVVVAFSLLSAYLALRQFEDNADLNRRALIANAQIVDRRFEEGPRPVNNRWFVTYQFNVNGKPYRREMSVEAAVYDVLPLGAAVQVKFAPEDPNFSTLADRSLEPVERDLLLLMIFGPAAACIPVIVWAGWRSLVVTLYQRRGVVLKGEITECRGEERGGNFYLTVRYRFTTPEGRALRGGQTMIRDDLRGKPLPQKGDQIAVLYAHDRVYRLL
jgi:hypothetical protein